MWKRAGLLVTAGLMISACGPPQATVEPASVTTPKPKGPSLGDIQRRVDTETVEAPVSDGVDPAAQNISPFRGIYSNAVRSEFEDEFAEVRKIPGNPERMLQETELAIRALKLSMSVDDYVYILGCAAAFDARGRFGEEKVFDAQYNSKFWMYGVFAELDQRNPGSVGGIPEEVPGIEKFPDQKRTFTYDPEVLNYRRLTYMNYRFARNIAAMPTERDVTLRRAAICDERVPPTLENYKGWTLSLK